MQLQARDAGFDRHVEILDAHAHDLVHLAQVDRDAAADRVDVPFERGAGAEGHDRHAMRGALIATMAADFIGRVRKADDVGRGGRVVRLAVAVMLADGRGVVGARAEHLLELGTAENRVGARWPFPSLARRVVSTTDGN